MGSLLLAAGFTYVLISRISSSTAYKIAVGVAVLTILILVWINLAVGIIGTEDNPANLLYLGVVTIGIVGALISRLGAKGMSNTLFVMALAQLLVPIIAMLIWRPSLQESPGIIGVF